MNETYEYKIQVISENNNLDLTDTLFKNVEFKLSSSTHKANIFYRNGICKSISTKGFFLDRYVYEITMVPTVWRISLQYASRIHMDCSIVDIIQLYMKNNNFSEQIDYELKLSETYGNLEFMCQYNESDLDFLKRWCETYGIYFYFENNENQEKIIFSDSNQYQKDIKDNKLIYSHNDIQLNENKDTNVSLFDFNASATHSKYQFDHYEGSRQSIANLVTSDKAYEYDMTFRKFGGNPQVFESYNKFEDLENQRIKVYTLIGTGQSSVISMTAGGTFTLSSQFKQMNQKFLLTKIMHQGDQTAFLTDTNVQKNEKIYENSFEVIPYIVQYRPHRKTNKPIFHGILNGKIDGVLDDQPLVDELGRYKVLIPFDTSKKEDGKQSIFIRVVQPSASNGESGMHFKLLKGDEVAIGFFEGDIDRPIILGAINNSSQVSSDRNIDVIKRKNTSLSMDNDFMEVVTPQSIEIIGI